MMVQSRSGTFENAVRPVAASRNRLVKLKLLLPWRRGSVRTAGDHRVAMAFGVLGAVPGNAIVVDDPSCVAVSWPSFWDALDAARR